MARTGEIKPETAEKMRRVVELRRKRWQWDQVGAEVGISSSYACELYGKALELVPAAEVAKARAEECELVDEAMRDLIGIATSTDESGRTRVEAWSSIRGWSEHRAKMLGLNAPTKTQHSFSQDEISEEIERLSRELAAND